MEKTYSKLAKWLKWASLFVLLIPAGLFTLAMVKYFGQIKDEHIYKLISVILYCALFAISTVWTIFNIILFFASDATKGKFSPVRIRITLAFSLLFVYAPEVISILMAFPIGRPVIPTSDITRLLWILMPVIVSIGYFTGYCCAKKIQWKANA